MTQSTARPQSQIGDAVARAIHFLAKQQTTSGAWPDFLLRIGYSTAWTTAYTALALTHVTEVAPEWYVASELVAKAKFWLLSHLHPRGGWGYHQNVPPDADSTSMALQLLHKLSAAEAVGVRAGCLRTYHVNSDGGVGTFSYTELERAGQLGNPFTPAATLEAWQGWCSSTPSVTAASILAWLAAEVPATGAYVGDALRYINNRQSARGWWTDLWWKSPHYPSLVACKALVAAGGDSQSVARAERWLVSSQNPDGGWGQGRDSDAFATGTAVSLLALGGHETDQLARGVAWLLQHQDYDGGYPAAAVMQTPAPHLLEVGEELEAGVSVTYSLDHRRCFTTATVVEALSRAAC